MSELTQPNVEPEVARFTRSRGLSMLLLLVAVGMGIPAFYLWSVPRLEARAAEYRAAAPSDPEGRVATWFRYAQPNIFNALILARFSTEMPWYVTHVVERTDGPPEIWGIDFSELGPDVLEIDGILVKLVLPAPELLARDVLVGDRSLNVPVYRGGTRPEDPGELVRRGLSRYLERKRTGLQKDIPGADLVVEVGGVR